MHDHAAPLGVTTGPEGPRLRAWSSHAERMSLCLLSADGTPEHELELRPEEHEAGTWQVTTPLLQPGCRYALRADGPAGPKHAFDPGRLLLDPYAHAIEPVIPGAEDGPWCGRVLDREPFDWGSAKPPRRLLRDTVIYELHVKGFTQLAGFLPEHVRGSYAGLAHPATIERLAALGITAVELLPVHAFTSERFLRKRGLRNYWGYSTLGFFAPHAPYASRPAREAGPHAIRREFQQMVRNLHEAGIEVFLDVVYNHTAEGGADGPAFSFRGLDHASYYRLDEQGRHVDVTGTGNALDASRPAVRRLILDSLAHWAGEYHIDGFRFDLAATLGRDEHGAFRAEHPLLSEIAGDPRLAGTKIIAEPWDVGEGGWRTGGFPRGWSEWNDTFRDRVRAFWVSDLGHARHAGAHPGGIAPLATALAGSSPRFSDERGPLASINYVTAHDGFTLHDLVSYNVKHNLLNGEIGRDGTTGNHSYNFGEEGRTENERTLASRGLVMRALLGSLLLAAGVPMITAGDEHARNQGGNNNPYNQDNETSWVSWEHDAQQRALTGHVARLLELRRSHPALRPGRYNHDGALRAGSTRLLWFNALGEPMSDADWASAGTRTMQYLASAPVPRGEKHGGEDGEGHGLRALGGEREGHEDNRAASTIDSLLIIAHGSEDPILLRTPVAEGVTGYELLWDSAAPAAEDSWRDPSANELAPGASARVTGPSLRVYRALHAGHPGEAS